MDYREVESPVCIKFLNEYPQTKFLKFHVGYFMKRKEILKKSLYWLIMEITLVFPFVDHKKIPL